MSNPFCFVCEACDHPASLHGLRPEAAVSGPYKCRDCGCEIAQNAPVYGWSSRQFENYRRSHKALFERPRKRDSN